MTRYFKMIAFLYLLLTFFFFFKKNVILAEKLYLSLSLLSTKWICGL